LERETACEQERERARVERETARQKQVREREMARVEHETARQEQVRERKRARVERETAETSRQEQEERERERESTRVQLERSRQLRQARLRPALHCNMDSLVLFDTVHRYYHVWIVQLSLCILWLSWV
jgi:hypothetical protein